MMQWFLPEQIGVWNWERWNDAEFAAMHKQALSEMDPKKRADLFLRMQDRMEESGAFIWLTNGVQAMMHRASVDPATTPDGRLVHLPGLQADRLRGREPIPPPRERIHAVGGCGATGRRPSERSAAAPHLDKGG